MTPEKDQKDHLCNEPLPFPTQRVVNLKSTPPKNRVILVFFLGMMMIYSSSSVKYRSNMLIV